MIKFPSIIKNRYEILFFYENPSLLIDKKINLNNKKINLNNQKINLNNEVKNIESITQTIITDNTIRTNTGNILKSINNQKETVTIKRIGNINNKKNIHYLNNYNIYSKLAYLKFYFNYTDEISLNKRFNGEQEFNYICDEPNIFKKILGVFTKIFINLISDKNIKEFNEHIIKLKLIFNENSKIEEKKNIINNIKKKYKKYEKKSDEEISEIILESINKCDTVLKINLNKNSKLFFNNNFINLDNKKKEEIKNILKLKKSNSGNIIKKSKKEYFENNIKEAFNKIRETNPNIKYCLVIDIKKTTPFKLNAVDKEYNIQNMQNIQNIQNGGDLSNGEHGFILLVILYIFGCFIAMIAGSVILGICIGLWPICLFLFICSINNSIR
jgi:hypothetical protein